MRVLLRFFGFVFAWASIGALFALFGLLTVVWFYGRDLPDTSTLAAYEPATLSRIYSGEGALMDEFARERRIFTPADEIPPLVKQAFVSAEDKNFYTHPGFDIRGIGAAVWDAVNGQNLRGASTITQQVMKNFLLSGERSGERKIKEIILAIRLEKTLTKEQILELYLNEIFLGQNAYGVTAAAQVYFGKTLEELSPGEAAYLAALPKAPSTLHPVRERERAEERRNYVLREMVENGHLTAEVAAAERAQPLRTVQSGDIPSPRDTVARTYFTEEIRRQLGQRFGEDRLFGGGLAVRATMDPALQDRVAAALRATLETWDRAHGKWRGPVDRLDAALLADEAGWRAALAQKYLPRDIPGWRLAVVRELTKTGALIGIEGVPAEAATQVLTLKDAAWTGRKKPEDLWAPGDVVLVTEGRDKAGKPTGAWSLRQIPELQGAIMAMDPVTGRVLALQGGFSYEASVFNRATQATRQPGSSFKPFIYAAALDRGFSPDTLVPDIPVAIDTGAGELWRPKNSSGTFLGFVPMRTALALSRNLVTVRLAQELGMDTVAQYAERFHVYDDMPEHLAYALGAGETTLWRMVAAYGMIANGGTEIAPTLVDRVQDRRGRTIYRHDARACLGCADAAFTGQPEPWIRDTAPRVLNAMTAFQLTSMLEGVVRGGTASRAFAGLDLDIAGKTGTTNESKDVWFIGYTPNLVVGCYVGYDTPRPMGKGATGGELCAPAVRKVFEFAKETMPVQEFRRPEGTVLVKIDAATGQRVADTARGPGIVSRLFLKGEEPAIGEATPEITLAAGDTVFADDLPMLSADEAGTIATDAEGRLVPPAPPSSRQLELGSGGLY